MLVRTLILAANPEGTGHLRFDQEIRRIQRKVEDGKVKFDLRLELAVEAEDLPGLIVKYRPNILHCIGHGTVDGQLLFDSARSGAGLFNPQKLPLILKAFNVGVQCIIFNSCFTAIHAVELANYINCVIAPHEAIEDERAIQFSEHFYHAIGQRASVGAAFDFAKGMAFDDATSGVPSLFLKNGIIADEYYISGESRSVAKLDAWFHMDGNKPRCRTVNGTTSYQVGLKVLNIPRHVSTVCYLYLDDSFEEQIDECSNLHASFSTSIWTYGDIDVGVIVFAGRQGRAFKTTLGLALDEHYSQNCPPSIAAALNDIKSE